MVGAEIATIAAAESAEPERAIAKATNSVVIRISIFFVGSVFLLAVILPWNSTRLGSSPYVSAFQDMGVSGAADIMNAVVLTAVLSCLNSGLYTSSRMLFVLADTGPGPPAAAGRSTGAAYRWPRSSPRRSSATPAWSRPTSHRSTVFLFLLNSSGAIILFVYLLICLSQLVMRRSLPPERLKVKMWFYPVLTLLTIAAMVAVLISMGVRADTRSQLVLSFLAWAIVLAAYFLTRRRPRVITVPEVAVPAAPGIVRHGAPAPVAADLGPISRVLVVANETVQADALLTELRGLHDHEHAARYFVCVPAHVLRTGQGPVWAPDTAVTAAEHRLETTLEILRGEGLQVDGAIGDYRPLRAIDQAVAEFHPDLIVISTHPQERSVWLRQDIVEQVRRKYSVPVRHVISVAPAEIYGT